MIFTTSQFYSPELTKDEALKKEDYDTADSISDKIDKLREAIKPWHDLYK